MKIQELFDNRRLPVVCETISASLMKWFGDSKVVDAEGNPLIVYHGTRGSAPVTRFDHEAAARTGRWTDDAGAGDGFHFSSSRDVASGYGKVGEYYLKIIRPLRISQDDVSTAQKEWLTALTWSDDPDEIKLADFISATEAFENPGTGYYNYGLHLLILGARGRDHDGVIFRRESEFDPASYQSDEYIVFHPDQIRPVTHA